MRRPTWWEWRAELEAEAGRWRLMTLALTVACIALVAMIVWIAARPAPVYFVASTPGGVTGILASGNRVPAAIVADFASEVTLTFGNIVADTAEQHYRRLRTMMTPDLQRQLASQIGADVQRIREQRLATSLTLREAPHVEQHGDRWEVRVPGHRVSWAGTSMMGEDDVIYVLAIVRSYPTEFNASGLAVDAVTVERVDRQNTQRPPNVEARAPAPPQ